MARGAVAFQLSGMAANPYPRPKEQVPQLTTCELCNRTIMTRDWIAHKNSKKHRQAEAKEKGETDNANGNANGFGGDASGFTVETTANGFGSGGTFSNGTSSGYDTWGSAGGFGSFTAPTYGNNTGGGGGDRACFSCGQTGHTKRDCPTAGAGGGQACYNCGQTGHQKRDCPAASGGQACYNCGQPG